MATIFLFCVPTGGGTGGVRGSVPGGDVAGYALAEDGTVLASHISSNESFSKYDLGFNSERHHEAYKEHYPDGFELEWVDDPESHEGFKAAFALNQQAAQQSVHSDAGDSSQ